MLWLLMSHWQRQQLPHILQPPPFRRTMGPALLTVACRASSPVLAAIIEAICFLNVPVDQIDVLSIGTTAAPFNIANNKDAGIIKWNVGMINLMFEAQAEAALEQAKLLLKDRVLRIDALRASFSLDEATPDKIAGLMNLGRGETVKKEILQAVKTRFVVAPKAPAFVPSTV